MEAGVILTDYTYFFLLVMARYSGIFLITPIFASKVIFTRIKIGLALLMAVVTFPVLSQMQSAVIPEHVVSMILDIVRELAIGFMLGFILFLVFAAIQLSGQFVDLRMGFRIANVFDPLTGSSSPIIGQFKNIIATLVFMAVNGHLIVVKNLYRTFKVIPPGRAVFPHSLWQFLFRESGDLFLIAFKIALPVIGTVFVVDVILGFLARSVPQMNIFIIGLPVKIIIGFILLLLSLHIVISFYNDLFQQTFQEMIKLIRLMGG